MDELTKFLEENELTTTLKNIAELDLVQLDLIKNITLEEMGNEENRFKKYVCEYNEEKYTIPTGVLIAIKNLKQKMTFTRIRVLKSGEGLKTTYQVVPLDPINKV